MVRVREVWIVEPPWIRSGFGETFAGGAGVWAAEAVGLTKGDSGGGDWREGAGTGGGSRLQVYLQQNGAVIRGGLGGVWFWSVVRDFEDGGNGAYLNFFVEDESDGGVGPLLIGTCNRDAGRFVHLVQPNQLWLRDCPSSAGDGWRGGGGNFVVGVAVVA